MKSRIDELRDRYVELFTARQRALKWEEVYPVNVKMSAAAWKAVIPDDEFEKAFGTKKTEISDTYPINMGMSTNENPEGKFLADVFNALPILLGLASEKTSS